jgi:hypothetical protein
VPLMFRVCTAAPTVAEVGERTEIDGVGFCVGGGVFAPPLLPPPPPQDSKPIDATRTAKAKNTRNKQADLTREAAICPTLGIPRREVVALWQLGSLLGAT